MFIFLFGPLLGIGEPDRPERIDSLVALPSDAFLVVLGCPVLSSTGEPNRYFAARIATAAAAYHALTAKSADDALPAPTLLCSGWDKEGEASKMVDGLIAASVPPEQIALDPDAFRTLDTIDGLSGDPRERPVVFISQDFHLPRVLFLARRRGVSSSALPAEGNLRGLRPRVRETLARFRALYDVA